VEPTLSAAPAAWTAPTGVRAAGSGKLPREVFLIFGNGLGFSLALLGTFLGIGILANIMIFYVVAQVMAERRENAERKERSRG